MSVVVGAASPPRLYKRGRVAVLILALLGLLTFAAVREMAGQCRTETQRMTDSGGGISDAGGALTDGEKMRCKLTVGGRLRIPLSEQVVDTLRRFGLPVSYI